MVVHLSDEQRDEDFEEQVALLLVRRLTDHTNIGQLDRDKNTIIWTTVKGRRVFITVEAEIEPGWEKG